MVENHTVPGALKQYRLLTGNDMSYIPRSCKFLGGTVWEELSGLCGAAASSLLFGGLGGVRGLDGLWGLAFRWMGACGPRGRGA